MENLYTYKDHECTEVKFSFILKINTDKYSSMRVFVMCPECGTHFYGYDNDYNKIYPARSNRIVNTDDYRQKKTA